MKNIYGIYYIDLFMPNKIIFVVTQEHSLNFSLNLNHTFVYHEYFLLAAKPTGLA